MGQVKEMRGTTQEPKTWTGKPYENRAMIALTLNKCKNELEQYSAKSNQDKLCH